jgi:hypothetical protein
LKGNSVDCLTQKTVDAFCSHNDQHDRLILKISN